MKAPLLWTLTVVAAATASTKPRRRSRGVWQRSLNDVRILQDDEILSETPPDIPFTVLNSDFAEGDVCDIGCEGDYEEIFQTLEDLWFQKEQEYELFFMVQGRFAVAAGVIYDNFPERVEQLHKDHPEVDVLILFFVPGSANDEAMVPGAIRVHELGYQTCVPSDGMVASGGTDFFTAGAKRYATPGSDVGIHSWAGGNGQVGSDFPKDSVEHQLYLDFYDEICIPQDFYWETLSHGLPMHYITEDEMDSKFPYLRDCSEACHSNGSSTGTETETEAASAPANITFSEDDPLLKEFFEAVDAELEAENIRGAAYAFRGPGMTAPIMSGFGLTNSSDASDPVDVDTAFMLASISKTYLGTAVGVLIDQGLISLDDDICIVFGGEISSACRNPYYPDANVTWRMMVTHRSSINGDLPSLEDGSPAYGPNGVNTYVPPVGNPACPLNDTLQFFDDLFVEKETETTVGNLGGFSVNWYQLAEDEMGGMWNQTYAPGEQHSYSNVATGYLASLIERVSGKTFPEFCQQYVFDPVGMNHTAWFRSDLPQGTREAMPQYNTSVPGEFEDVGHYCFIDYASGQLHSTIRDMTSYADVLLDYGIGTYWSNVTAHDHVFGCQEKGANSSLLPAEDCQNSLIWFYLANEKRRYNVDYTNGIGHSGGEAGISTNMIVFPEANAYVIVLANTEDADTDYLSDFVFEVGLDLLQRATGSGGDSEGDNQDGENDRFDDDDDDYDAGFDDDGDDDGGDDDGGDDVLDDDVDVV